MAVSPIQTRFDGGEVSRRVGGRFDSEVYKKSLDLCTNFKPTPQGSLLMRAGAKHGAVWPYATPPKLFPFRVAGDSDDHTIAIDSNGLRIFDPDDVEVTRYWNKITNGGFDIDVVGWHGIAGYDLTTGGVPQFSLAVSNNWESGAARVNGSQAFGQSITSVAGHTHRVTVKARGYLYDPLYPDDPTNGWTLTLAIDGIPGSRHDFETSGTNQTFSFTYVGDGAAHDLVIAANATGFIRLIVDDVTLVDLDLPVVEPLGSGYAIVGVPPVLFASIPWTYDQLDLVQLAPEPHRDSAIFFHGNVQPYVIKLSGPDVWEFYPAQFKDAPSNWGNGCWPGAAELGFQGRLFAGSTPNDPGVVWGSKVGSPFVFTPGVNPDDPVSFTISTKGRIVWLQGQKTLLAGGEQAEHSVSGSNLMISSGDVNIQDESAYGSAPIQGVHIGNQVIFVAKDRRTIRALEYSQEANGWITKALTFLADHMTVGGVRELHFAHSPDPMIIAVLNLGGVVGCVYDRSEQVIAWWRLAMGGTVRSAAVHHGDDGASVVLSVERTTGVHLEHVPLHEVGAQYLDAWASRTVRVDGKVVNCSHLAGQTVRCLIDGVLLGSITFDEFGQATAGEAYANKTAVVGYSFTATARLLPRNLKSGKAHSPKIGAILNESAIPKLNGKRAAERNAAVNFDTINASYTGKCVVSNMGWSEDDKITIEQDLPYRTEILAVFSRTEANEE
jgi:hypothetical protein